MLLALAIDILQKSGLKGMGGAGFPVTAKWKSLASDARKDAFLLISGHEGGFNQSVLADGKLSHKVKELIAVALSLASPCEWCITYHTVWQNSLIFVVTLNPAHYLRLKYGYGIIPQIFLK